MAEPRRFRVSLRETCRQMGRLGWCSRLTQAWIACAGLVIVVLGITEGWRGTHNVFMLFSLYWVPILAIASAEHYRAQPDADWADSGDRTGHVMWRIGRRLAKLIPPLPDEDQRARR